MELTEGTPHSWAKLINAGSEKDRIPGKRVITLNVNVKPGLPETLQHETNPTNE